MFLPSRDFRFWQPVITICIKMTEKTNFLIPDDWQHNWQPNYAKSACLIAPSCVSGSTCAPYQLTAVTSPINYFCDICTSLNNNYAELTGGSNLPKNFLETFQNLGQNGKASNKCTSVNCGFTTLILDYKHYYLILMSGQLFLIVSISLQIPESNYADNEHCVCLWCPLYTWLYLIKESSGLAMELAVWVKWFCSYVVLDSKLQMKVAKTLSTGQNLN